MLPRRFKNRGFTLVELITVMVLVGVLAAVAAPRFFDRRGFETRTFMDQTQFMLRYAQKLAIAQNRPVFVRLNGSSIALCFNSANCAVADRVLPPALNNSGSSVTLAACDNLNNWYCEGVPEGLAISATPGVTFFYYDGLGAPFAPADVFPSPISTFTRLLIRITGDGSNTDLFVEPETGHVHS
jgi:MSHA pilin protein MshC